MELEVEMRSRGSRRGHHRGRAMNENVDRSNGNGGHHHHGPISPAMNSRSGGSRYNRQYVSPANKAQPEPEEMVMDGDELVNYKLSEDFQALNVKKGPQSTRSRRRRNIKKNAPKQPNGGGANTIIGTLNGGANKSPSKKQSPPNKKKNEKMAPKSSATNANAVPLSVPKSRPAPVNWAANLKQKPVPKPVTKSMTNSMATKAPRGSNHPSNYPNGSMNGASSFQPHSSRKQVSNPQSPELMDSSRISSDASKVQHVLEVINMTAVEYQSVMAMFRRFGVETNALLSVKGRWFVCFDSSHGAVHAVNTVRDNKFKLRRIDCNAKDVEMLKNNVPPPMRVQPKGRGIGSGGRDGRKQGMPHRGRGQFESHQEAPNHVNGKRAVWGH